MLCLILYNKTYLLRKNATVSKDPVASNPNENPPIPEHTSKTLIINKNKSLSLKKIQATKNNPEIVSLKILLTFP